ncbi:MAG: 16S rRNA (adenine(1518)-N(6)/adenine(1519)-N(6))-dimethyltransferase RsmA [Syntrophobacteraceae bacterium]
MMKEFLTPSQYFHASGTRPRKQFGQHFLNQPATAVRIVQSADLKGGEIAVEIGPGLGALTRHLLPLAGKLHLIELDREMSAYLNERLPPGGAAQVHEQDALTFDFADLGRKEGTRLVLLGNLPYNISSPLLFHLLEAFPLIDRCVFMVQKEVGQRFAASPGTKDYGVLSVLLGNYASIRPLFTVGPNQFYPPPKVESLVIRIDFFKEVPSGPPFDFLRGFVSVAFQQRRKTLFNSLKGSFGLSPGVLSDAFEGTGIDPKRRPETLSPSEFLALAEAVRNSRRRQAL